MNEFLEKRIAKLESKQAVTDAKRQKLEDIVGNLLMAISRSEEHYSLRASVTTVLEEYREALRE